MPRALSRILLSYILHASYCYSLHASYMLLASCLVFMHRALGICETVLLEGPGRGRGKDAGNCPLPFLPPHPSLTQLLSPPLHSHPPPLHSPFPLPHHTPPHHTTLCCSLCYSHYCSRRSTRITARNSFICLPSCANCCPHCYSHY